MYIITERKWHLSCHCHDNSYVAGPVLIGTNIPRFYLKQGSSTPNNLMARVNTIWEPLCIQSKTIRPTLKSCKWGYLVVQSKRLEPWQQNSRFHFVPFLMFQKIKRHSSPLWKPFQISSFNYFLLHRYFKMFLRGLQGEQLDFLEGRGLGDLV